MMHNPVNSENASKMKSQQLTPFMKDLWTLIGDPATNSVIEWSKEATNAFVIKDRGQFEAILPRVTKFKHNNFDSFTRQLNLYGFKKCRKARGGDTWQHPFLEYDKLHQIKRKETKKAQKNGEQMNLLEQTVASLLNRVTNLERELQYAKSFLGSQENMRAQMENTMKQYVQGFVQHFVTKVLSAACWNVPRAYQNSGPSDKEGSIPSVPKPISHRAQDDKQFDINVNRKMLPDPYSAASAAAAGFLLDKSVKRNRGPAGCQPSPIILPYQKLTRFNSTSSSMPNVPGLPAITGNKDTDPLDRARDDVLPLPSPSPPLSSSVDEFRDPLQEGMANQDVFSGQPDLAHGTSAEMEDIRLNPFNMPSPDLFSANSPTGFEDSTSNKRENEVDSTESSDDMTMAGNFLSDNVDDSIMNMQTSSNSSNSPSPAVFSPPFSPTFSTSFSPTFSQGSNTNSSYTSKQNSGGSLNLSSGGTSNYHSGVPSIPSLVSSSSSQKLSGRPPPIQGLQLQLPKHPGYASQNILVTSNSLPPPPPPQQQFPSQQIARSSVSRHHLLPASSLFDVSSSSASGFPTSLVGSNQIRTQPNMPMGSSNSRDGLNGNFSMHM